MSCGLNPPIQFSDENWFLLIPTIDSWSNPNLKSPEQIKDCWGISVCLEWLRTYEGHKMSYSKPHKTLDLHLFSSLQMEASFPQSVQGWSAFLVSGFLRHRTFCAETRKSPGQTAMKQSLYTVHRLNRKFILF
jgi:hypothetical protein